MHDPRAEYEKRLDTHLKIIAARERQHVRLGNIKLAVVIAAIVLAWLAFSRHLFSPYWLLLPAGLYIIPAIFHEQAIRARTGAETAASFYRRGIARIEDRWTGTGASGDRFRNDKHVYSSDLDLFGKGCLFELLSTARMPMGEDRLAEWLGTPSPVAAVVERQCLAAELRPKLDFRETLAGLGDELPRRFNPKSLTVWAEGQSTIGSPGWRIAAGAFAISAVAAGTYLAVTGDFSPLFAVLFLEMFLYIGFHRRAGAFVASVDANAEGLMLFAEVLDRIEREAFTSPGLQELAAELKRGPEPASHAVRQFARIVHWIDAHDSLIARLLNLPLLYTVQTGFAAEAWRKQWGKRVRVWLEITGQIEALLSLASYSFEHPADPFPEFTDPAVTQAFFDGEELGHPLIPAGQCVRNSIRLDRETRLLFVSGSNMSGKSTLLRTAGINTVLAMAGAPIRGKSLRLTPLILGTRIRSGDSLREGRSNFYTEALRIKDIFDLTNGDSPVLFLFDELLEGTNSHDRRIGAESLVHAFLERGAIGMVTTHDLALTAIAPTLDGAARNVHLQDYVENGTMRFDYKLHDGIVTRSNALELMRLIGLKV